MSINPSDYDLHELRKMARERGGDAGDRRDVDEADIGPSSGLDAGSTPSGGGGGQTSYRAGLYRELLPLEATNDAEKPYLDGLPEHYGGENLVFEWLEFLLLHAGYQGAVEALNYYEAVGWITEDCESTLNDYLLGLEQETGSEGTALDIDDHLLSLVYIAKLASMT
jgi:flagellar protein FlaE